MAEISSLSRFKFFSEVAAETLGKIAGIAQIRDFEPATIVFRSGEPAEHLYGLMEGEVDLSLVFTDKVLKTEIEYEESIQAKVEDRQKSIVVDTVRPGQVFGWASVVGPGRRTVTAICVARSRVIALPAVELKKMLEADQALGYVIMKRLSLIISKRLQNRTDKLIETWVEAFDVDKI